MKILTLLVITLFFLAMGCQRTDAVEQKMGETMTKEEMNLSKATFAGGCFWCTEADFEKLPGAVKVISGYAGGQKQNPTYQEVSSGTTGHVEAVQVYYDPAKITYYLGLNLGNILIIGHTDQGYFKKCL